MAAVTGNICIENLVTFERVVHEMHEQTDRQTDRQTDKQADRHAHRYTEENNRVKE